MPIKSKTKDGYQVAYPGDSIDTAFSGQNSRRGRVGNQVAHTLTTSATQAYYFIDLNPDPKLTEIARCITARHDSGISNRKAEHSGVFVESMNIADDEKFAFAFVDPNGEVHIGRIRKLTPSSAGDYRASRTISSTRRKQQDYPTAGYTKWQEML